MMKIRLLFLLFVFGLALLLSSCASKEEATVDEKQVVEASAAEIPVVEPAVTVVEPEVPEPAVTEQPVAETAVSDEDSLIEEETLPEEDLLSEEDVLSEDESEFVPVEEKPSYIIDVASYYDDFQLSEDDFVVMEMPAPEPEPELEEEPVVETVPVLIEEPEEVAEVLAEEEIVSLEETAPVMEPIYIPAPRKDMKKPVSVISEEQAAAAAELENEDTDSEVEEILAAIPEPEEPAGPVASRSVTIRKNDIIEVPYQGNWWVYLGDTTGSGALTFTGRDYIAEKTVFTLRAVNEGQALLHFFKQDIIANVMVDDYLEVIVGEAEGVSGKTTLDMYIISQIKNEAVQNEEERMAEEPAEMQQPVLSVKPVSTDYAVSESLPESSVNDTVNYVEITEEPVVAVEEIQAPEIPLTDAELFARAQELEATDIEEAVELYKKLMADYPTSPYWTKANNRVMYINRFYFFKR